MPSSAAERSTPVIAGIGVATGFGYGKETLIEGLFSDRVLFGSLLRPGRQAPDGAQPFIGIEVPDPPEVLSKRVARTVGLGGRVAAAVVREASDEARLGNIAAHRIGLVVGGSNLHNRELMLAQNDAQQQGRSVSPHLGYGFFDTDLCGLIAETFGVRGPAYSVGGASASGAIAVIQAAAMIASGQVDACIAIGALQDLSWMELSALRAMGALGESSEDGPGCRPFDVARNGFVFGESAAAIVLMREDVAGADNGYASIAGVGHVSDAHRGPDPSREGELAAIRAALDMAGLDANAIDYVNTHGTGTPLGDDTEAAAIRAAGLTGAAINATKSIIGHGIASAGAVEIAATALQMRAGRLHPTHRLETPIDPGLDWVRGQPLAREVRRALSLSFGFGGINTAVVLATQPDRRAS